MKRDMELVREILLRAEAAKLGGDPDLNIEGYDEAEIGYNLRLMADGGLVDGTVERPYDGISANVHGLTWYGHDFLDAIRVDSTWVNMKEAAAAKGYSLLELPFEIVKQLATRYLHQTLGL